ncbi:unnamed protein product [Leptidea sinapis]|uniref:MADF domain-containing protein n=1 Tax=Leptidea sinapis TaxID=189913 RepID=A0A5E4PRX8_9NEOP|nr:unnamed protein product [Leptidea sinapis]
MSEWSEEKCLSLIDAYREHSVLWNPKDKNYYKKHLKEDAWAIIGGLLNESGQTCKQKMMPYLNQKQIEEYLALINDGEISEDDLEDSDTEGNENFYENGDDLLHDLESPLEEENDDPDNDPFMAGDPPLINEATANDQVPQVPFPSTSQASRRATMRGLVWKVKKIVLNSDQTAFHGDTTYPPELKDEATTGKDEIYESKWYAFKVLGFLNYRFTPREGLEAGDANKQVEELENTDENNANSPTTSLETSNKKLKADPKLQMLKEAFGILKHTANKPQQDMELKSFFGFIQEKMKYFSRDTKNAIQQEIFQIVMRADQGYYNTMPNYGYSGLHKTNNLHAHKILPALQITKLIM